MCEQTGPRYIKPCLGWSYNETAYRLVQGSEETGLKVFQASTPIKKPVATPAQSYSPATERQADATPVQSSTIPLESATEYRSLPRNNGAAGYPVPDLLTKNDKIRRVLARVDWARLRGDMKQEVATFRGLQEAETKFQEFESYIRAEGRNLNLPDGLCKPFERVLIQSTKAGAQPCPYILFTDFRTEEDVRKFHAALSRRKVRNQYYPPLRLCYELQKLSYNAANASVHVTGDLGHTLCGKTAIIEAGEARRLVTIGGIIQIDNNLYAMTAGHSPSAERSLDISPEADPSLDNPFDNSDFDDDIHSALVFDGLSISSEARSQRPGGHEKERHRRASTPAVVEFRGSSINGDDWSLHLIKDPLMALPNAFPGIDGIASYLTHPASQPVSSLVWLLAGVSGGRVVQMLPGIVTFPLPSGKWINAWKVSLVSTTSRLLLADGSTRFHSLISRFRIVGHIPQHLWKKATPAPGSLIGSAGKCSGMSSLATTLQHSFFR